MARLANADLAGIRALESHFAAFRSSSDQLQNGVSALHDLLETERTACYTLAQHGEDVQMETFVGRGMHPRHAEIQNAWLIGHGVEWAAFNCLRPEPWQRNRVLQLDDLKRHTRCISRPIIEEVFPKVGLYGKDQLRIVLCDGASLLGWLGSFQAGVFDKRQRRILARVAPSFARWFKTARVLGSHSGLVAALDAAMDAIGAPAFLTNATGSVLHANSAGAALLNRDRRATAARISDAPDVTVVCNRGQGVRRLVVLHDPGDAAGVRVAAGAKRWGLTARQAAVLNLLASGTPNRTIAAELGIAERTVEAHVTAILDRASVESRSELIAALLRVD